MYIWELMGVTEKFAFQMWKNNIDLLGFMRELLRVGIFTEITVHHTILRLILKYSFCASSSHELSVCAIFYVFYNSVFDIVWLWWQDYYNFKHQNKDTSNQGQ